MVVPVPIASIASPRRGRPPTRRKSPASINLRPSHTTAVTVPSGIGQKRLSTTRFART
jgi:hypothetical protein